MKSKDVIRKLRDYRDGKVDESELLATLSSTSVADLGFAQLDLDRDRRNGFPEVVFAQGKSPEQTAAIAQRLFKEHGRVLITRASEAHAKEIRKRVRSAVVHPDARLVVAEKHPPAMKSGYVAVICAGTSDLPVAEEAAVTAETMGNRVERISDIGVAGLHRVFAHLDKIRNADVLIVVAGMEGALPSVIAGLTSRPVIAVPTSVGYGANFQGLAAMLGMLNSCGSGVTVVNIDNGFGAAYAAAQITSLLAARSNQG